MFKVKIYGAGSIGNHLAHACRNKGWEVLICDLDPAALERTKNEIYPSRYGKWDNEIRLSKVNEVPNEKFNLVIIGTPPDTHLKIALHVLENESPDVLLIEKPLCTPTLELCNELFKKAEEKGIFVGVCYNHVLTQNTKNATEYINNNLIGNPLAIYVNWLEYWGGIFSAHPWLSGPKDSYLGFYQRGGGACGEHSHAINIFQHFSNVLKMGRIKEVTSVMDIVDNNNVKYDQSTMISVKTENGLVGNIIQDVITEPSEKMLRIIGDKGLLKWFVNFKKGFDAVKYWDKNNNVKEELIEKSRPDDFKGEIDHVEEILKGKSFDESPISLKRGIETMIVIAAAYKSNEIKRTVKIDYSKGMNINSIVF